MVVGDVWMLFHELSEQLLRFVNLSRRRLVRTGFFPIALCEEISVRGVLRITLDQGIQQGNRCSEFLRIDLLAARPFRPVVGAFGAVIVRRTEATVFGERPTAIVFGRRGPATLVFRTIVIGRRPMPGSASGTAIPPVRRSIRRRPLFARRWTAGLSRGSAPPLFEGPAIRSAGRPPSRSPPRLVVGIRFRLRIGSAPQQKVRTGRFKSDLG